MSYRTVAKTSTYMVMHFVVAVGVAFALTRDWRIAIGIGLIEPLVQTVAYAVHERGWERLPYMPVKSQPQKTATVGA